MAFQAFLCIPLKLNLTSNSGQALWLAIANLISFSFGIISAAILSRLLSVEEYGSYRQVLYVYSTLLVVFTLGLPRAYAFFLARLPLEEGRSAVSKINSLFLLLGGIFTLVLFFGSPLIADILKNPSLIGLLRWFSLTPLFLLPIMGIESVMATYKKSKYATTYVLLSRTFSLVCVVLPVIIIKPTAEMAVIGFTVSSLLCYLVGMILERRPFKNVESKKSSLKWSEILKYSFPLLFSSIWGIIYQSCPQFFISRWWGTATFAEFSNGFIELPFASMVIGAVATVLLPALSRNCIDNSENEKKEIIRLWRSAFEKSAMIIYPLAIFACVFANPIMDILYGKKYIGASIYFQIILIINLTRVIPFAPVMMALNQVSKYSKAMMIGALVTGLLEFLYVIWLKSAWGIALIQCLGFVLMVALMFKYISSSLKISVIELIPIRNLSKLILISVCSTFIAYEISSFISYHALLNVLIGFTMFLVLSLSLGYFFRLNYLSLIQGFLKR